MGRERGAVAVVRASGSMTKVWWCATVRRLAPKYTPQTGVAQPPTQLTLAQRIVQVCCHSLLTMGGIVLLSITVISHAGLPLTRLAFVCPDTLHRLPQSLLIRRISSVHESSTYGV